MVLQAEGHAFSAELHDYSVSPIARVYRHDTDACWEAPYSSTSGYGTWETTSIGPLGVNCTSVMNAVWYTSAISLTNGENSTTAGAISSGHIGITHMVHEKTLGAVFGGEMDGRTMSNELAKGKPVRGEIYLVSTANSVDTLVSTTEANAQPALQSAVPVDPASAGGLTSSSAESLISSFGSFRTQWDHSSSVAVADSYGQVAHRCPSDATGAYIAIEDELLSSRKPSSSLQRLDTANTAVGLDLLVVSKTK